MNCVCYNIMNRFQNSLGNLLSTLVNNRFNNGLPSSDDGTYQPNLNLLNDNDSSSFDSNTFFYDITFNYNINNYDNFKKTKKNRWQW